MPTASRASEWSLLPDSFQTAWPALEREFPGVQAKFRWGRVHAIYGRPFGGGRTPLQSAENFISEFGGDLFGINSNTELVLGRVTWPREGEGPAYVRFHQEYLGRPLDGAHLSLTIANRAGYPITLASGFIHPTPGAYLRERRRSREQTIQIARGLFGERNVSIDRITEIIWPVGKAPEYGWAMDVVPVDAPDDGERITVGTFDGRVLRRTNLVYRFADYTATVLSERKDAEEVPIECDSATTNDTPLQWVGVRVLQPPPCPPEGCFDQTVNTNASGQALFTDVPATFDVTAAFENLWFVLWDDRIQDGCETPQCCNANPNNCVARKEEGDQSISTFRFTNNTQLRTVQLVTTWHWLNTARDWVDTLDASFILGDKLEVRGNVLAGCSPGYNPDIPRMKLTNRNVILPPECLEGQAQGFCECKPCVIGNPGEFFFLKDLHLNTIAVHEYGHHLHTQEHRGASSGTWKENIADAISAFVTNEPYLGKDICEESLGGPCEDDIKRTRNIATPDMVWPNFVTGLNANGRPMANAYWDMREDLGDNDLAGKIVLHSIKKLPGAIDPVIALHAVLVDDDSGVTLDPDSDYDLSNGSPNYETINAAFRMHGLATDNVAYVDIDWSGSAPGDVADNVDLDVAVTVAPGNLTLVDCILAPPCPVRLRWRKNSGISGPGAWEDPVDMQYRTIEDDYHATISSANYSVGDVIDFYVRVQVTDTSKQYTCFPTQAQFDWSIPNADNIPEERDFFSVLVTDSAKITALSEDLRDDPSWTVGVDEWEFGAPDLVEWGEQPGNDYPFDDDFGGGISPKPNCYFTSSAGSVQGEWELTTAFFDLSDSDVDYAVVSYALWFFARAAEVGDDQFEVQLLGSDSTWYPIQTIDVDAVPGDGNDTKLVRWIRQRITVQKGSAPGEVPFGSAMKLRFRAIEDAAIIEAVVDEVRVWGVIDQ